MAVSAIHDDE